MRAAIVFAVLCLATVSLANEEEEFKKIVGECTTELGIKMDENGEPNKDEAEKKCLAKCIGQKMGVMDEAGEIKEDSIPDEWKDLVKECSSDIKETDVCKKANELEKCVMSKIKER